MRFSPSQRQRHRPSQSPLIVALLSAANLLHLTAASPYPRDDLHDLGYDFLQIRDCNSYCGSDNQLCCSGSSVCTTLEGDVATCVSPGGWGAIVTTWTETRTYTSTIATLWEPAPEPTEGVDCIPTHDEQEACGPICCAGWQTCAFDGQCSLKPGFEEPSTVVITTGGKTTTQYSAPYRVTGTTTVVNTGEATKTADATTTTGDASEATETSDGATGAGGSGGSGLSGGAIAGIVVGSLAGAAILLLLAFCCIARGLWNVIFGGKKKKNERVDIYEEGYSRRGSRDRHSGWFGGGGRASSAGRTEKKSGGKKWLGLAGLAATLFALLNLRKKDKPARKPARSRYSDSYYSYSGTSSAGTRSSSGAGTYHTRRPGGSRGPPRSYYSKSSRSRSSRP